MTFPKSEALQNGLYYKHIHDLGITHINVFFLSLVNGICQVTTIIILSIL